MLSQKFSPSSGNITRFFIALILLLLVMSGLTIHHAINAWLTDKRHSMTTLADSLQKRINAYRFVTWKTYENQSLINKDDSEHNVQETRLRQNLYYLEKENQKTEALIFGSHDSHTLKIAQNMSVWLDSLWGKENSTWSMYYLNGQDNSLILVSTLPLREMATRYKESSVNSIVESRRAEMLQQANILDERESFSVLRRFNWQNDYYFTIRTTFNQPGHLATVVGFDLPVSDLIPHNMPLRNFQLRQYRSDNSNNTTAQDEQSTSTISVASTNIEIAITLPTTPLKLVYHIPLLSLVFNILHNLLWPLLANFLLIIMAVGGMLFFRQQILQSGDPQNTELEDLRQLSEEMVSGLPLGVLVYDFSSNRVVISNKIAEHLLPHLNLQKIINMSDQHHGVLQTTVNNEIYEIRHSRSLFSPQTRLFVMRSQDHELLVTKKLQKAQQVLERNHQMRQQLLQNLGHALYTPLERSIHHLNQIDEQLAHSCINDALQENQSLIRLVEDILLLNQLETRTWIVEQVWFNLQELLDDLAIELLPAIRAKGLVFLIINQLNIHELRLGDRGAIRKILTTLLYYSLATIRWGKITLEIDASPEQPDQLLICMTDTNTGLSTGEIENMDFPWIGTASSDRYEQGSGMALFLCKQLCKQLGGHFAISTTVDIGTRYTVRLPLSADQSDQQEARLLEDVIVMVDVTAEEIAGIVTRQLESWGATCLTPDERFSDQPHDLVLTDAADYSKDEWVLLLTCNEIGFRKLSERQYRVNYNMSSALQSVVVQVIENQVNLADSAQNEAASPSLREDYFLLFVDTVPDDVKKLYNVFADRDYVTLAQTAHRLKGVFAMLDLSPGKQLCETLEQHIQQCNDLDIEKTISDIDHHVNDLLKAR